jgi:hypothetical protein
MRTSLIFFYNIFWIIIILIAGGVVGDYIQNKGGLLSGLEFVYLVAFTLPLFVLMYVIKLTYQKMYQTKIASSSVMQSYLGKIGCLILFVFVAYASTA